MSERKTKPMPRPELKENSTDARLGRLEIQYQHLEHSLDSIRQSVDQSFQTIYTKIDQLGKQGQITWPLIFTSILTLASILSIAGVLHQQSITPIDQRVVQNRIQIERQTDKAESQHAALIQTQIQSSKLQGAYEERFKTLSAKIESTQHQLEKHEELADHPLGVLVKVEELKARIAILENNQKTP